MDKNYKHAEAYCLMNYQCKNEDCKHQEVIWNSRDGVTPYTISCPKCRSFMSHIDWNKDVRFPKYMLSQGELYFDDLKLEELIPMVRKRLDSFDGTEQEVPEKEKDKKAVEIAVSQWYEGMPTIKEATPIISPWNGDPGILAMPLVSNVPEGREGWEIVECPVCGNECWWRPGQEGLAAAGLKAACTICALQKKG